MTKKEMIDSIYEKSGVPRTRIEEIINSLVGLIHTQDKLYIHGLGMFKHTVRAARTARNPITGQPVEVPEKVALTFKASKTSR